MKKNILTILAVLIIIYIPAYSEDAEPRGLSMDEAVEIAIANSEDMMIRSKSLEKMNYLYKEVRSAAFPKVSAGLKLDNYIESPFMEFDLGPMGQVMGLGSEPMKIPLYKEWSSGFTLQASQVIWAFGKVMTAIELADRYLEMEKITAAVTGREIGYAVRQIYLGIVLSDELTAIAQGSYDNARKNTSKIKEKYSDGRISRVYNIKMEADLAMRTPIILQAEKSKELACIALSSILDAEDCVPIITTDGFRKEFPELDGEDLQEAMLKNDPMMDIFTNRIDINSLQMKLKKSDFLPMLVGYAFYSLGDNSDSIMPEELDTQIVAGLKLDTGARGNAYRQAKSDMEITELELTKYKKKLKAELSSALAEYRLLLKTYMAAEKAMSLAQESYEVALSSLESGVVSQTMLNDAELQFTGAKMEVLQNLFGINMALIKIEKLTGREL